MNLKPWIAAIAIALLITSACAASRPRPLQPMDLYILHNPGKDGEIWSVGYGPESTYDFNRRARVHSQTEAEKAIALTIEAAPNRFRFAGLVRI